MPANNVDVEMQPQAREEQMVANPGDQSSATEQEQVRIDEDTVRCSTRTHAYDFG
jgi:hypothetical protein